MISIHEELAALSGNKPAGYLSLRPLAELTLKRLDKTVCLLRNKEIKAGDKVLSASLSALDWDAPTHVEFSTPNDPVFLNQEVDILIKQPFVVTVNIFVAGEPESIISKISVNISDARAHIRAENNVLILEGADFESSIRIERTPNSEALLTASNIDPLEASRVEGHLAYGVISETVALSLAKRTEIQLSEIFPVVDFGTTIELIILQDGRALGIIPKETVSISTQYHCDCSSGPDLDFSRTNTDVTSKDDVDINDEIAVISIGGPVAEDKDPMQDFGRRSRGWDGQSGLYIPLEFASSLVGSAMPAVKIKASDNGTIGYQAEANVGFHNFRVDFDLNGGGILLDIELDISISAYCDLKLSKGTRLPIGWAVIKPTSRANIQMGFYPAISKDGVISLKSTLKRADMGRYVAVVIGIGSALAIFGVTSWIGFLIDVVLSNILSHQLPIELRKVIRKHLGSKEWKLLDGLPLTNNSDPWNPRSLFDVTSESLLVTFDNQIGYGINTNTVNSSEECETIKYNV